MERYERIAWGLVFLAAGLGFPAIELSTFGCQYLLDQGRVALDPSDSLWASVLLTTASRMYALALSLLLLCRPRQLRLLLAITSAFGALTMATGLSLIPSAAPIRLNLIPCALGLAATLLRWNRWTRTSDQQMAAA